MSNDESALGPEGHKAASTQRGVVPEALPGDERLGDDSLSSHDSAQGHESSGMNGSASDLDDELVDIERLLTERDEYLDALRRIQAEFENYRKRIARDESESISRGIASFIERLLPILDAFDLALVHIGDLNLEAGEDDARVALIQIAGLARASLEREGLARIDEAGVAFDPKFHNAVSHIPLEEGEEPSASVVYEVLRAGYSLKGKVIRPAMVTVRG